MSRPWVVSLAFVLSLPIASEAQEANNGTWKLRVALVLNDLEVRPVPLHMLRMTFVGDTNSFIETRTGLDGTAEGEAPAGAYLLHSVSPVSVSGVTYSWSIPVTIPAGTQSAFELTNANASIDSSAATAGQSGRKIEDAVTSYRRFRASVFRIEAGLGHGTGFLVDSSAGLVVTNAHVVTGQLSASAVLDSITRVPAVVLARSEQSDVAVLRVPVGPVLGRQALPLADPKSTSAIVEPGERVLAIGYPLNQEQTLTTGIVSSIRSGAIISDVNINPGNSGGPMLNYGGLVVGVNTFGDASGAGPGVAGAIVATTIWPVLEQARLAMDSVPPPPDVRLPTMPTTSYPLELMRAHADTVNLKRLKDYSGHDLGPFEVSVRTPVTVYLAQREYDDEVARDRRKREERAGLDPVERYSQLAVFRDWVRYASDLLTPVVQVVVQPKVGETTGSVLGRMFTAALAGVSAKATYKFQGDVRQVRVYRNGVEVQPIRGGSAPIEQYIDEQWVSLKDVANVGAYFYSPLVFAPDSAGVPPSVVVVVDDLKNPDDTRCGVFPAKVAALVWNDFVPYVRVTHPDVLPIPADPSARLDKFNGSIVPGDSAVVFPEGWNPRKVTGECR